MCKIHRIVTLACLSACAPLMPQASAPVRPHIVFLLADDLGWKDVGFHGSEISTPHIDQLAREGARLEQFYVMPVCSPTRACLMTGRYPIRYGLQTGVVRPWANHGLPLDEYLLPQALRAAGYVTAICGKWHLGHIGREYLPTSRGFDHQYGHYNGAIEYFTHMRDGGHDWNRDDEPVSEEGYATNLIATECERLIAGHDKAKPLFLYVPFNAPHTPLEAPKEYIEKYAEIGKQNRRKFAAMITCMDDAIGRILHALDERGMREDSLVFFASDNGGPVRGRGAGNNRPLRSGKHSLYEGGVRVPAVACWPGRIKAGSAVAGVIHMVDMHATLLGLAGASTEGSKPLDGLDAWAVIAAGASSARTEMLLNVETSSGAVRVGDWKLVRNGDGYELFDLANDPGEKVNLASKNRKKLAELKGRLAHYADAAVEAKVAGKLGKDFKSPKYWGHDDR